MVQSAFDLIIDLRLNLMYVLVSDNISRWLVCTTYSFFQADIVCSMLAFDLSSPEQPMHLYPNRTASGHHLFLGLSPCFARDCTSS